MVPTYANGRPSTDVDISKLAAAANLRVHLIQNLSVPAVLTVPFGIGSLHYRLALQPGLPLAVRRYITLHEAHHVLAGDIAEQPVVMRHTGPLPECEPAADLFALLGLVDDLHLDHGPAWVEDELRRLVPVEDRGWQLYRCADLAPRLIRMRRLVDEWLD